MLSKTLCIRRKTVRLNVSEQRSIELILLSPTAIVKWMLKEEKKRKNKRGYVKLPISNLWLSNYFQFGTSWLRCGVCVLNNLYWVSLPRMAWVCPWVQTEFCQNQKQIKTNILLSSATQQYRNVSENRESPQRPCDRCWLSKRLIWVTEQK